MRRDLVMPDGQGRWLHLKHGTLILGLGITITVILTGLFAPLVAPHDYVKQSLRRSLSPPCWYDNGDTAYVLGTDQLGRDLLSRIIWGARTSLMVGVGAVLVGGSIGTVAGLASGYFGGRVEDAIMAIVDIQLSFPPVFLAIAMMAIMGKGTLNVAAVLGVVTWVQYARLVRGTTLAVKENEYVDAARALGASSYRIIRRHILPNILSPLIVISTVNVAAMILVEAGLSYLGVGVQPPTPAWGSMLGEGKEVFRVAWWNAVFPGLAIVFTVLGVNLLGDGLSEALP